MATVGPGRGGTRAGTGRATAQAALEAIVAGFDGRVGAAIVDGPAVASVRGGERFPLQSVMKLVVAAAALDAVDRGRLGLADPVLVRREDLSLFVQPLAELVDDDGYQTTIGDLVGRAVVDSDSAAADILFGRIGGAPAVAAFLARRGIAGVRVDRDERHLQTAIVGLAWRPEYVDPAHLEAAIAAVPAERRAAAFAAALVDERDTATPLGMASLLVALATGRLLTPASTAFLLAAMRRSATFPDRLRAGAPPGWGVAHKTGTGPTWDGVNQVTADVGLLEPPGGAAIAVAVFVAGSRRPPAERAALIAGVARGAAAAHGR